MQMIFKNILARKKSSLKIIVSFTVMITVLCVFMTYLIALDSKSNDIIYGYRSGHYYRIENKKLLDGIAYDNVNSIDNLNDIVNFARLEPVHGIFDIKLINESGEAHECGHYGYSGGSTPPNATAQEITMHKGLVDFIDNSNGNRSLITQNDKIEQKYRWEKANLVSSGKEYVAGNEIVISKMLAEEFKLENSLNKQISVEYAGRVYGGITVVGILSSRFYDLTGNEQSAHIYMSTDSELYAAVNTRSDISFYTEVNITDYLRSKAVANDLATKAGVLKLISGSDYGLAMASTLSIVNVIVTGVMVFVGLGVIVALLLNVLVNMGYLIIKKSNYYGIIRAYGLNRLQLFNMMFLEIFILSMISVVVAFGLTYGIVALFDIAMASLIGIGVTFTPLNIGVTFIAALMIATGLALMVAFINYLIVVRKNTVTLLKYSTEN